MTENPFKIGNKYILAFVGDGKVKCFETAYKENSGKLYGRFGCGVEIRIDNNIDKEYIFFFNITNSKLNDLINCSLYIFSSTEKMKQMLKPIIGANLEEMKKQSESILNQYMKLADDCTSLENQLNDINSDKLIIDKI